MKTIANVKIKCLSFLTLILLSACHHAFAAKMTGFAEQYYQDDLYSQEVVSQQPISPTITIGNKAIQMEATSLTDIADTPIQTDSSARWVCLHSQDGVNYWFISDNEMGRGLLTAIAIAKDGNHKECVASPEFIRVSIAKISLLDTNRQDIAQSFGINEVPEKEAFLFYRETPVQGEFTQSNTLSYYFNGEKVRGVIVGQITSN
ncbi:hypothetical protein MXF13_19655 [Leclercia adecarboxylata]|uniref:hypothetical protein n=1 Tax=Leclercia adecarboxylata TaxID=83655 RepID=UPI002DBBD117|nr:hypothetical protein [Leclercia adecarboxylata]MEB5752083.1 hypothetical protein [Leclercia adecarboxylata]